MKLNTILQGDCIDVLGDYTDDFFDLIVTSPPYAVARKSTYGGIPPAEYIDWFLPRAAQFFRVLKPTGTFILNIKENAHRCERLTYVLELILALKTQGWLWTEEFIWHKKNCVPGKWPNRFRDAWERLLQFNKQRKFAMYQEEVMVPVGNWAEKRLVNLSDTDKQRDPSGTQSGFGKRVANWERRKMVYPSNVLHLATECANRGGSAVFPVILPDWFIRLFTQPGDVVLDPFIGTGTTAIAARKLGRHYVGVDILESECIIARKRIEQEGTPIECG